MKSGISYWSLPGGLDNLTPIDEALSSVAAAGFEALELAIAPEGVVNTDLTREACEAIRSKIDASGLAVQSVASGMSWAFNPTSDDASVREKSIRLHAEALQRTAWLGCEAMLFVPGVVNSPIAPDEHIRYDVAIDRARDAVGQLLEVSERVGVDLCLENVWNGLFLSPLELVQFVDSFGSDRLGVYLDCGNLLRYHQRPAHWIELLGHRIKRVHVKGFSEQFDWSGSYRFTPLSETDVPWRETVTALRAAGYDKTVVAEMLPHRPGLLEETAAAMKSILA